MGSKGVNVNAIAPRLINTGEMMRVNYPTQADLDAVLQKIPVRRLGAANGYPATGKGEKNYVRKVLCR